MVNNLPLTEITKLDWSLRSGSKATMSCRISGIQIQPTDVTWGVITPTHAVKQVGSHMTLVKLPLL